MQLQPEVDQERVYVFPVENQYVFKHYFDGEEVFNQLKRFYNNHQYCFEVPGGEFESLKDSLADYGYALKVVEDVDEFVIVVEKYTSHPDNIFKSSVIQRGDSEYNFFLMADPVAVEQAALQGGTRLTETDLVSPFS